jgi:uncharacterized protein DUF4286
MIVYNITIKILPEIEKEWIAWQHQEHIPEVMASGCFTDHRFYRLLDEDEEGITYVVQYFASSLENYHRYSSENAESLRQKAFKKWGNQFIAFRTVMQVVS